MIINLNLELEEQTYYKEYDCSQRLIALINGGSTWKKTEVYLPLSNNFSVNTGLQNKGFIGLLSHAYSYHKKLAIAPHDIWSIIIGDLVKYVGKNSEQFRSLFTQSTEGKTTIIIPSGSLTEIPMSSLSDAVKNSVLFDANLLTPAFSTNKDIHTEYFQALLCDLASPYYDYSMFCCGIKAIKLLGNKDDWELLISNYNTLMNLFCELDQNLIQHFNNVSYILENIIETFDGDKTNFWQDIFTQKNVGSGGDLTVDGWITELFIEVRSFAKIQNFTTDYAIVKYEQLQTKEKFAALYGGFDYVTDEEGFIKLNYSKHIFRLTNVV